ncbi:MAG TPA: hypothetical protein VHZ50_18205 [Puia sp.]|nr:hypothetical protein [Puia sp.]
MRIKRKIIFCLLFQFAVMVINAQQLQNKNAWRFQSINNIGLIIGQKDGAFDLQTVNGFQRKSIFAGVGVALDYYGFRSIPLFVDLRKYFGSHKNAFFIYEDCGVNFDSQKSGINNFGSPYHYNAGFYNDIGAGYKFYLKNKTSFLVSGGYTYKRISETISNQECPFGGPCYSQTDKYFFDLSRLILKFGLQF